MDEIQMKEVEVNTSEMVTVPLLVTTSNYYHQGVSFSKGECLILIDKPNSFWFTVR